MARGNSTNKNDRKSGAGLSETSGRLNTDNAEKKTLEPIPARMTFSAFVEKLKEKEKEHN